MRPRTGHGLLDSGQPPVDALDLAGQACQGSGVEVQGGQGGGAARQGQQDSDVTDRGRQGWSQHGLWEDRWLTRGDRKSVV